MPRLFLDVVNKSIRGNIVPETIRYKAPTSLVLKNATLVGPDGGKVARITDAEVNVAVSEFFLGRITLERVVVRGASVNLIRKDGALNLVTALEPTKESSDGKSSLSVRLENISLSKGRFDYLDGDVRIEARGIQASGEVVVKLANSDVRVAVDRIRVREGGVFLKQLDIPLKDFRVDQFRLRNNRLRFRSGTAKALDGASVAVDGTLDVSGAGAYALTGLVDVPQGNWPPRLTKPGFPIPSFDGNFSMSGPLADPTIVIDGALGAVRAYDLRASRGAARVIVDRRRVRIDAANLAVGTGAKVNTRANGSYTYDDERLDLKVVLDGAPLSELIRPAALKSPPRGVVSGSATVRGVADGDAPLAVDGTLKLYSGRGFSLKFPSPMTVQTTMTVSSRAVDITKTAISGGGRVSGNVTGRIDLDRRLLNLDVNAEVSQPGRLIPDLPADITIARATGSGKVSGSYKTARVDVTVDARGGDAYGVPLDNFSAQVSANKSLARITKIKGTVAQGQMSGDLVIDYDNATTLDGSARLENAMLGALKVTESPLPVAGRLEEAELRITGLAKDPSIEGDLRSSPLEFKSDSAQESLGTLRSHFVVDKRELALSALVLEGGAVELKSALPIWYRFEDTALGGRARMVVPALAGVRATKDVVRGRVEADVLLNGTRSAPDVHAILSSPDLRIHRGPRPDLELGVLDAVLTWRELDDDQLLQVSAKTLGPVGHLRVRASYAVETERMNADVRVVEFDLAPVSALAPDIVAPLEGRANGRVQAWGAPSDPNVVLELSVPELSRSVEVAGGLSTQEKMRALKPLGPLLMRASLKDHQLHASVCAALAERISTSAPRDGPCDPRYPFGVSADGVLDVDKGYLDTALNIAVDQRGLEELIVPLRGAGVALSLATFGAGRARWQFEEEDLPRISGDLTLAAVDLKMEGAPQIHLEKPARVRLARQTMTLSDPLIFAAGDARLALEGKAAADDIDLRVRGDLGLPLIKLYTDEVTVARGSLAVDLSVKGPPGKLLVEGAAEPREGAAIGVRALRQTLEFKEGRVELQVREAGQVIRIARANALKAAMGDGSASLYGELRFALQSDGPRAVKFTNWDVHLSVDDVYYRQGTTFVEADADLTLAGAESAPRLSGRVDLSDGSVRETFDLRDFVLEVEDQGPSKPFHQTLDVVDLGNLVFDIDATVRNFRGRAELGSFPLDIAVAGDFKAGGSARVPQLVGALYAIEGEVVLPYARFEVANGRFEWLAGQPGLFPQIALSALAELPAQGNCDVEVPVELTLEGKSVERIDLSLSAQDSGAAHSRSDLLKAVLGGTSLPACAEGTGVDLSAAWRALLAPVSTQVSREIESLLQGSVGGRFTINPYFDGERIATDVRWQLGRRVELVGETGIRAVGEVLEGDDTVPIAGADVRMRLLLFDPFLIGNELFLEGEINSEASDATEQFDTRLETRLKWRIFER